MRAGGSDSANESNFATAKKARRARKTISLVPAVFHFAFFLPLVSILLCIDITAG
jgi:hypothetical protein